MDINGQVLYSPNSVIPRPVERARYHWTTREIAILKATYAQGIHACMDALPGRTDRAIYMMAFNVGLKSPKAPAVRRRWSSSEHIDAAIRRAYEKPHRGVLNDLSVELMRPRTWLRDRAIKLGVAVPRYKPTPWLPEEDKILREMAGRLRAGAMQRALAKAGYQRTESAVIVRLKRLGESRAIEPDDDKYSTRQLADLMGVNGKTVSIWIERGLLKAKEIGQSRGDGRATQWRIKRTDVRAFIVDHPAHVDLRKVERYWFIELLHGRAG